MINSQDKILQKTERMIYFHIMFMSASSIKRKSTLLLREATRSFIFRSATTFPGRKHLRENAFLGFRFEMLTFAVAHSAIVSLTVFLILSQYHVILPSVFKPSINMKIDHTLSFLQYFIILRIYHCNEYAYLSNP